MVRHIIGVPYRIANFLSTLSWAWQVFGSLLLAILGFGTGRILGAPRYILALYPPAFFLVGIGIFWLGRVMNEPRQRLSTFYHSFAEPAFLVARDALVDIAQHLNLGSLGESALGAHIRFAVVEPAEQICDVIRENPDAGASAGSMQRNLGEFCLRYHRMRQSIEVAFPIAQTATHMGDTHVAQWRIVHGRYQNALRELLTHNFPMLREYIE